MVNRNPGNSYTIEFPDFDPYAPHLYPDTKDNFVVNHSPWRDVVNTSQPHILMFADEALMEMEQGDILGAFNASGECFGMAEYEGINSFYKLIAMGNNPFSKQTDGFENGETMRFNLYRPGLGITVDVTLEFDTEYPNYDGLFAVNGVSRVVGLTMAITSVNEPGKGYDVNVYPNPARETVKIVSDLDMSEVNMLNHLGQAVTVIEVRGKACQIDVSAHTPGMYFLRIETIDGNVITKRLLIK